MAFLTRAQIKTVVIGSLERIADRPDEVEEATFDGFDAFQTHVFLTTLKGRLNALPYTMNNGSKNHLAYYDVDLTPDSTDDWPTVKDCIDWIDENQKIIYL